jgi:hypothetical protein
MVDTASAEKEHGCGKEDRTADHASRRRSEGDEHDAPSECEGSHSSMQPTTQPRLDRVQHFGQGLLGIAFDSGLGWLVFANVNSGQSFSFRRRSEFGSLEVTG